MFNFFKSAKRESDLEKYEREYAVIDEIREKSEIVFVFPNDLVGIERLYDISNPGYERTLICFGLDGKEEFTFLCSRKHHNELVKQYHISRSTIIEGIPQEKKEISATPDETIQRLVDYCNKLVDLQIQGKTEEVSKLISDCGVSAAAIADTLYFEHLGKHENYLKAKEEYLKKAEKQED